MEGTVVSTTASPRELWSCFLLLASLRQRGNTLPVRVACRRIKSSERELLEQFADVSCIEYRGPLPLLKVHTLSALDADVCVWIDPEYLVTGLLQGSKKQLELTWRDTQEMRDYAQERLWDPCSELRLIPEEILEVWRHDVGERDEALTSRLCSLSTFSVPRQHRGFLQRWEELISRLLKRSDQYLLPDSVAYAQIDEASFNALLAFLHDPPASRDNTLAEQLLHGCERKAHLTALVETLQWVSSRGYRLPDMPRNVRRLCRTKRI